MCHEISMNMYMQVKHAAIFSVVLIYLYVKINALPQPHKAPLEIGNGFFVHRNTPKGPHQLLSVNFSLFSK